MRKQFYIITLSCLLALFSLPVFAQTNKTSLQQIRNEFSQPSNAARTKLWWFHGETETTREGITADLEAFKKEGVGGVVYYDQQHGKGENALTCFFCSMVGYVSLCSGRSKTIGINF